MNIYIDEAGPFIPPKGSRRYSLVLALVVPTAAVAELSYQFLRLRDSWPQQAVEIKGSKLDEDQAAQVMNLLATHGAIAEYYAIDMALHPDEVIDEFKERQAVAITANLTVEHAEAVVRRACDDAETIRNMAKSALRASIRVDPSEPRHARCGHQLLRPATANRTRALRVDDRPKRPHRDRNGAALVRANVASWRITQRRAAVQQSGGVRLYALRQVLSR